MRYSHKVFLHVTQHRPSQFDSKRIVVSCRVRTKSNELSRSGDRVCVCVVLVYGVRNGLGKWKWCNKRFSFGHCCCHYTAADELYTAAAAVAATIIMCALRVCVCEMGVKPFWWFSFAAHYSDWKQNAREPLIHAQLQLHIRMHNRHLQQRQRERHVDVKGNWLSNSGCLISGRAQRLAKLFSIINWRKRFELANGLYVIASFGFATFRSLLLANANRNSLLSTIYLCYGLRHERKKKRKLHNKQSAVMCLGEWRCVYAVRG